MAVPEKTLQAGDHFFSFSHFVSSFFVMGSEDKAIPFLDTVRIPMNKNHAHGLFHPCNHPDICHTKTVSGDDRKFYKSNSSSLHDLLDR